MLYRNLFVWVVHKGFSFFMGLCRIYSNTTIARWIIRQMYEMLRHEHPVPGALSIIIRKRIVAMMTRGTNVTLYCSTCKSCIPVLHFWTCSVFVKIYKKYFWGLIPPYLPLNTALISHMADVPNVTAPRVWSADLYDLSRNAYRSNDLIRIFWGEGWTPLTPPPPPTWSWTWN